MYFFERAFRPFFLGAALFAVVAMIFWWWQYPDVTQTYAGISAINWHAHEMIFGYALATVTGFLLTAAMNWSRMESASGWALMMLFTVWLLARLGYLFDLPLGWIAVFDLAFSLGLVLHFAWPVWQKRLKQQVGLLLVFVAIFFANLAFYTAGDQAFMPAGVWWSAHDALIAGLFLVLTVNLTMLRRLTPFFTEKTLGLNSMRNSIRLDQFALGGFILLLFCVLFSPVNWLITLIAWPLAIVFAVRQAWWYHKGIWAQLLLWPMHVSYAFITLGILLYGFVGLEWLAASLAIHALAAGGIGLLCSSMMARISLGHTNRNVFEPPRGLVWVFIALAFAAVARVLLPIIIPQQTLLWIELSQLGWIAGFALLVVLYWKILTRPSAPNNSMLR